MDVNEKQQGRSGKRARLVCHRCHQKKLRCDLKSTTPSATSRCAACTTADATCEYRPSNKGRRRKVDRPSATVLPRLAKQVDRQEYTADDTDETISQGPAETRHSLPRRDACVHQSSKDRPNDPAHIDSVAPISAAVQQSNLETYFEYFYIWCPIIDPDPGTTHTATIKSPLVQHALASLANSVRESSTSRASQAAHYARARQLFYASEGEHPIDRIRAAMLLTSCTSATTNPGSIDSNFWWTGVAIRQAQDLDLHREPHEVVDKELFSLQRRIWWTLYARERITAICQRRPCIIHEDYYDVRPPQLDDSPSSRMDNAHIFFHWVRLAGVIGDTNKRLLSARRTGDYLSTQYIASQLVSWLHDLPATLYLPITSDRTVSYNRDIHLLHLPYLSTILSVYLNTSNSRLPEASVAAVIAAACIARIFEDFLARGPLRFVPEDAAWSIGNAVLALMHVRPLPFLTAHANADIKLLRTALSEMATVWDSAQRIDAGLDKLLGSGQLSTPPGSDNDTAQSPVFASQSRTNLTTITRLDDLCAHDGVEWPEFFPFVTIHTSPLLHAILTECRTSFPQLWSAEDLANKFNEYLEEFDAIPPDWSPTIFS